MSNTSENLKDIRNAISKAGFLLLSTRTAPDDRPHHNRNFLRYGKDGKVLLVEYVTDTRNSEIDYVEVWTLLDEGNSMKTILGKIAAL